MPSAARCPSACSAQTTTPNGNLEADAGVSIMAHEIEETATDALGDGFWDSVGGSTSANPDYGEENGDLCAWTFGPLKKTTTGAYYNQTFGSKNWLIQVCFFLQ